MKRQGWYTYLPKFMMCSWVHIKTQNSKTACFSVLFSELRNVFSLKLDNLHRCPGPMCRLTAAIWDASPIADACHAWSVVNFICHLPQRIWELPCILSTSWSSQPFHDESFHEISTQPSSLGFSENSAPKSSKISWFIMIPMVWFVYHRFPHWKMANWPCPMVWISPSAVNPTEFAHPSLPGAPGPVESVEARRSSWLTKDLRCDSRDKLWSKWGIPILTKGFQPEKGGRKPALSPNLFVSAEKCRGSGHDRSYHPKRPLTIPYEQKPKPSAAPLEDFSLLCNPSPPPSSISLLIPLQTILFRTPTDAALRWASEFLHFPPFSCCF